MHALIKGDETAEGYSFPRELQVVAWDYGRKEHTHHPQFRIYLGSGMRLIPNFRTSLY